MLKKTIEADFITAFKSGDKLKKNTLGILKTAIFNWGADKKNAGKEITEEDIIGIVSSEIKKRNQAIDMYKTNPDAQTQMENEMAELEILKTYLPTQMTEEEMLTEINNIKKGLVSTDKFMPVVMGHFNKLFKGKFDNKALQELIKQNS